MAVRACDAARRLLVALVAFAALGCDGDARARAEADRVVGAVRALREAADDDKPARLAALRAIPCQDPKVCELERECAGAYDLYLRGRDATRAVKKSLDSDGGEAERAGLLLEQAKKDVELGRSRGEACVRLEGEVSVRFKLR